MKTKMGRLAIRGEGNLLKAYYAQPDTMDGAVFLGSIQLAFVIDNEDRKQRFMKLMQDSLSDILEEEMGVQPEWVNESELTPEIE